MQIMVNSTLSLTIIS